MEATLAAGIPVGLRQPGRDRRDLPGPRARLRLGDHQSFMPALRDYCMDKDADLFDDRIARLEELKHLAAGRGTLGAVIADCAHEALLQGMTGQEAIDQALHQALTDRLARNSLQMEEHVLRETGGQKASDVRGRLASAMSQVPIRSLVQKLGSGAASSNAAPAKHAGLDDGVGIR